MCGDCIELFKKIDNKFVTLTLTDIPYTVVNRKSNGLRNLDKGNADHKTFELEPFLKEVVRITKGSIYIFCSTEQVSFIRNYLVNAGLTTRLCLYEKSNPSPLNGDKLWLSGVECCIYGKFKGATFNEFCKNTVWKYPCVRNKRHPTEKPLELFNYLVKVSSNENDIVFDPCAGSGTTAVAAKKNNRKFIAFELDENYVNVAKERLVSLE